MTKIETKEKSGNKGIQWAWRMFFYILAMVTLALGIILNKKAGLGVSPIVSVADSFSQVTGWDLGNVTLMQYCIFVVIEFILKGKNAKIYDILQIPLSIAFTRVMNIFNNHIHIQFDKLWQNLILLLIAIILTGIGAAMSVNMKLVPNPGDGIVAAIADKIKKPMGFTKNCFDFLCISITFLIGLITGHFMISIGIGTVAAVIGVGRSVAGFNYLCKKPMAKLTGTE